MARPPRPAALLLAAVVLAALAPPAPALQKDCINQNQKTGMSCVYGASTHYANSCLVDTSKTCVRGGVNHPTASKYCYGCVIYKSYCEPAQQQQTPPDFVVHRNKHSLVLPTQPCRGVEDWYRPNCGGVTEPIWTFAFKEMLNDVNKPRDKYGLAINPTSRRGQHQMHVHIAPLMGSLIKALDTILALPGGPKARWHGINCSKDNTLNNGAGNCVYTPTKTGASILVKRFLQVTGGPSTITPFNLVYSNPPGVKETTEIALAIFSPKAKVVWVFKRQDTNQAECFFNGKECTDCHCTPP